MKSKHEKSTKMKMTTKLMTFWVATALLVAGVHSVKAITVNNPSFEDPTTQGYNGVPTGWTLGGGSAGVWNTSLVQKDGNQVVYLSQIGFTGSPEAWITQTLTDVLQANTVYTLSGYAGWPSGYALNTTWTASLLAGNTPLGSASDTGETGESGLSPFSFTVDSSLFSSLWGQPLTIKLHTSKAQSLFDDIHLTARTISVPDAGFSLTLFGFGFVALRGMRRVLK